MKRVHISNLLKKTSLNIKMTILLSMVNLKLKKQK